MNANVLRRFIVLMVVAMLVIGVGSLLYDSFIDRPPGDYETEKGDIHLSVKEYDQALSWFNEALTVSPDHRGALMGRAVVFMQTDRPVEALAELDYLIDYLERETLTDDPTGRGTLAAAYANRGIVHDRAGRYQKALDDYVSALKVDADAVEGPGLVDKIIHDPRPSTVRKRARYIYEQLQLPEDQRLLSVPEMDARQRMHKP